MTGDTRDVDAMNTGEVHGHERLAVDAGIGDEDTLGDQRLVLLLEVDVDFWTDECHNGLVVSLGRDDEHLVAHVQHRIAVRDRQLAILHDA